MLKIGAVIVAILAILAGIYWLSGERVRALQAEMQTAKVEHAAKQSKSADEIVALRKQKREVIYAPREQTINAAPADCIPMDGPIPDWLFRMLDDAGYIAK